MTDVVYTHMAELARSLSDRKLPEWSDRLTDAVEEGSTGTEILMRSRWELEQLLAAQLDLPEQDRAAARDLIDRINRLLTR